MPTIKEQASAATVESFHQGRVWRGRGRISDRGLLSTWPWPLPQATLPQICPSHFMALIPLSIIMPQRECALIQGPALESRGPGQQTSTRVVQSTWPRGVRPTVHGSGNQRAFAQSVPSSQISACPIRFAIVYKAINERLHIIVHDRQITGACLSSKRFRLRLRFGLN